jgi:hypothetical protein
MSSLNLIFRDLELISKSFLIYGTTHVCEFSRTAERYIDYFSFFAGAMKGFVHGTTKAQKGSKADEKQSIPSGSQ